MKCQICKNPCFFGLKTCQSGSCWHEYKRQKRICVFMGCAGETPGRCCFCAQHETQEEKFKRKTGEGGDSFVEYLHT